MFESINRIILLLNKFPQGFCCKMWFSQKHQRFTGNSIFGSIPVKTFFFKKTQFGSTCKHFGELCSFCMKLQLSCQQIASTRCCGVSQKQNQPLNSFRVRWKKHKNTFHELRNHCCLHPKCSSLLHVRPCLFFSWCSSCKAELPLFPSKMWRLHAWPHPRGEPIGYTWHSKSSLRVCASPNSLGVISHIW